MTYNVVNEYFEQSMAFLLSVGIRFHAKQWQWHGGIAKCDEYVNAKRYLRKYREECVQ